MPYAPVLELARLADGCQLWLAHRRGAEDFARAVLLIRASGSNAARRAALAPYVHAVGHPFLGSCHDLVEGSDSRVAVVDAPVGLSLTALVLQVREMGGSLPWPALLRMGADVARGALALRRATSTRGTAALVETVLVTEHGISMLTAAPRGDVDDDLEDLVGWLRTNLPADLPASLTDLLTRARAARATRRVTLDGLARALDTHPGVQSRAELAQLLEAEVGAALAAARGALTDPSPRTLRGGVPRALSPAQGLDVLHSPQSAVHGATEDRTTPEARLTRG